MVCEGLEVLNNTGIADILAYPTTCDYQFYAKILGAFFVILAFILWNNDKERMIKPDMLSSLGVAGIATIILALAGTLVGFIEALIFIEIAVGCMIFIVLWLIKG